MSSAPSPPSEQPGARADQASEGDGSERADPLEGWRRLARTLDRDVPARLAVTRAATRKIARAR